MPRAKERFAELIPDDLKLELAEDSATWLGDLVYRIKNDPSGQMSRASIAESEVDFLASMAANRVCLDLGTGTGLSCLAMAQTALEVITVDKDSWIRENIHPYLNDENVRAMMPNYLTKSIVDVAFVDCGLESLACTDGLLTAAYCLKPGGVIMVHDSNVNTVMDSISKFCTYNAKMFYSVDTKHGITVIY